MNLSPNDKLKLFFSTSKPEIFKKGETVLRIGDARSGAFFVKKGYVKDSSISPDGREFTFFIFKPNDIFSYSWIFNKIPNEHSFRALTDCEIYETSRVKLLTFFELNPDVYFMVSQSITARLRGLMQRMESIIFGNASQRVASIFFILGERFGYSNVTEITIPIHLTHKDIAELIGISRETTSTEIKKLIDDGIIKRISNQYILTKPRKLQKMSSIF